MQTLAQMPIVPSDQEHTHTVQFSARNRELGDTHKERTKVKQTALVSYNVCKHVRFLSSHWPI